MWKKSFIRSNLIIFRVELVKTNNPNEAQQNQSLINIDQSRIVVPDISFNVSPMRWFPRYARRCQPSPSILISDIIFNPRVMVDGQKMEVSRYRCALSSYVVCEMCVLGIIAFISHVLIVWPEARGQIVGGQGGVAELSSKYIRKVLWQND